MPARPARRQRVLTCPLDRQVVRGPAGHQARIGDVRVVLRAMGGHRRGDPLRSQAGLGRGEGRLTPCRDPRGELLAARSDVPLRRRPLAAAELREQRGQRLTRVADQRERLRVVAPDFLRIDVDLDHGRTRRRRRVVERRRLAGLAADVDDDVGIRERPVGDGISHRAADAQRQSMVVCEDPLTAHRRHDGSSRATRRARVARRARPRPRPRRLRPRSRARTPRATALRRLVRAGSGA